MYALTLTSASSALSIEQVTSLYIAFLSFYYLKEYFNFMKVLGLILALLGSILVISSENSSHNTHKSPFLGDMLVLFIVSSCAAIYMFLFKLYYIRSVVFDVFFILTYHD